MMMDVNKIGFFSKSNSNRVRTIFILGHQHSDTELRLLMPKILKRFPQNEWVFCYEQSDPFGQAKITNIQENLNKYIAQFSKLTHLTENEIKILVEATQKTSDTTNTTLITKCNFYIGFEPFHNYIRKIRSIGFSEDINIYGAKNTEACVPIDSTIYRTANSKNKCDLNIDDIERKNNHFELNSKRNHYMAKKIIELLATHNDKNIFVFLGAMHVRGIKEKLEQNRTKGLFSHCQIKSLCCLPSSGIYGCEELREEGKVKVKNYLQSDPEIMIKKPSEILDGIDDILSSRIKKIICRTYSS